ncbi:MAG: methyl-accepting chemotaxis protein [Deltaproteobacteria bacterium]|nr:methyl-accepting chemotaxis protein [Deltaproteobacteria bacterium]
MKNKPVSAAGKSVGGHAAGVRKQSCFASKELQFTLAFITVISLLAGIFLQSFAGFLVSYYALHSAFLGIFLITGYAVIVVLVAVFFTHRFIGPFKRIEYEMKLVAAGELSRRLSARGNDDLHVRNFVRYVNEFIGSFEAGSAEYDKLTAAVSASLEKIRAELSKEGFDCERLKAEILSLQKEMQDVRKRW